MDRRDIIVLQKILKEIKVLEDSMKGFDMESFIASEDKKRATSMTLINIGELTTHLTDKFKTSTNEIPFKQIKNLRNIAAHGYHSLNFDFIWNTVKAHVPNLKSKIEELLN